MGALTAAGCGALLVGGVLIVIAGLLKAERAKARGSRLLMLWESLPRRSRLWVNAVLLLAIGSAVVTSWAVLLPLVIGLGLGVPWALSTPPEPEIEDLAALDRWLRLLGPSIGTGKSIRDAILVTSRHAPERLRGFLGRVVSRIDLGWTTRDALLVMADEMDSPEADGPLAALALASARGGVGSRALLTALTDHTRDRLRATREIAAERLKPLLVVRQVVAVTLVILAGMVAFSPGYFRPFGSPLGQLLAAGLVLLYVGSLLMLRSRMRARRRARLLGSAT